MDNEELAWLQTPAYELWALDKLILARTMGYICGPVGMDVPKPGWYIVRPCVNLLGLGLGAEKVWLEKSTDHLPLGYFWCEWFEGKHHSVDYKYGNQILAVRGYRTSDILTKWDKWEKVTQDFSIPPKLHMLKSKRWLNIEFIEDEVIEVHYRNNPDFEFNNKEFLPVWEGESTNPPEGYTYIEHPDIHGRIGGFIR
tara:strand:- start:110 stop:700 length:591 start_codon:yes stop_codon:yes gene_type:complete